MVDAFFLKLKLAESTALRRGDPRAPVTVVLHTAAIFEVSPGLQERLFTHTMKYLI